MNSPEINIKPFGVHSVLIEWPNEVSEHILETIIGFQTYIRLNMYTEKDWEMVPSYNSLLLVNRKMTIDFEKISKDINVGYSKLKESEHRYNIYRIQHWFFAWFYVFRWNIKGIGSAEESNA